MDLSIIIPIYNEEENLKLLLSRLTATIDRIKTELVEQLEHEFLFVNDGSNDQSLAILKEMSQNDSHCSYINFSRNFGHQNAVSAGLDYAKGQAVVIIDGDLQDPPEFIFDLYQKYKTGYDVVYAQRILRKGEGVFKKQTASFYYKLIKKITNISIPVNTGDFRLIDRKVVRVLRKMPEKNKFIRGQVAWTGFRQVGLPYERDPRHRGETSYTFGRMTKFALDGITAFSDLPLKLATYMGFLAAFIALIVTIYTLYSQYVIGATVKGWTSLMIAVLFIGGVQLLCIGLIGEYLIRLTTNIRNRPLYVVESTNILPDHEVS